MMFIHEDHPDFIDFKEIYDKEMDFKLGKLNKGYSPRIDVTPKKGDMVRSALKNFELYYNMPKGSATVDEVKKS